MSIVGRGKSSVTYQCITNAFIIVVPIRPRKNYSKPFVRNKNINRTWKFESVSVIMYE